MNSSDRMVVQAFLDELAGWRINDTNPTAHKTQRRMALAEVVSTEIQGDDIECLALRALAAAATDLCISPADAPTIEAFLAAKRTYLEIVQSGG